MNCNSFENVVDELAREQMMEAIVRDKAMRHAAHCADCAARLNEQQELTVGLRQLSAATEAVAALPELQPRLLAEFRKQHLAAALMAPTYRSRRVATYWPYAAIAAALLIVAGIGAMYLRVVRHETTPGITAQISRTIGTPVHEDTSSVPQPAVLVAPTSHARPRRSAKHRALAKDRSKHVPTTVAPADLLASNNEREITTAFIPIGYSSSPTMQDGGQVVRVELPRTTMARFGLPVNMERYDERVKADLWLGADGFARAIRFVQ